LLNVTEANHDGISLTSIYEKTRIFNWPVGLYNWKPMMSLKSLVWHIIAYCYYWCCC